MLLFLGSQIGKLDSWVKGDLLLIDHEHSRGIIVHIPDNHRHLGKSCSLGGMGSAMSGDDLIAAIFQRSCDQRCQDAKLCDTFSRS